MIMLWFWYSNNLCKFQSCNFLSHTLPFTYTLFFILHDDGIDEDWGSTNEWRQQIEDGRIWTINNFMYKMGKKKIATVFSSRLETRESRALKLEPKQCAIYKRKIIGNWEFVNWAKSMNLCMCYLLFVLSNLQSSMLDFVYNNSD